MLANLANVKGFEFENEVEQLCSSQHVNSCRIHAVYMVTNMFSMIYILDFLFENEEFSPPLKYLGIKVQLKVEKIGRFPKLT